MNAITKEPPEGMTLNAVGGYTPTRMIKPELLMEDQLVQTLLVHAIALRDTMAAFREMAFTDVDTFLDVLAERYGAKRGGATGNTTLTTFDGKMKVQVATGDFITFGPELQIAKHLIDECLTRWTDGGNDEIKTIVHDAFDVGKEGRVRVDRVLGLRRLNIDDPTWQRGMTAIGDAIRTTHSKRYVRFYERDTHDAAWEQVSLDLSRVAS